MLGGAVLEDVLGVAVSWLQLADDCEGAGVLTPPNTVDATELPPGVAAGPGVPGARRLPPSPAWLAAGSAGTGFPSRLACSANSWNPADSCYPSG